MKPLEIAPEARDDLIAIARFIATDNPERAESFVAELVQQTNFIAERPQSFPARDDLSPGLRVSPYGRYIILFRDLPNQVRVVRFLHTARNLKRMFTS